MTALIYLVVFTCVSQTYFVIASSLCNVKESFFQDSMLPSFGFTFLKNSNIFSCAAECLMTSLCLSFNFDEYTGFCYLNYRNSSTTGVCLTSTPGVLFSDISAWPQRVAGPCAQHTCSPWERCTAARNYQTGCDPVHFIDAANDVTTSYMIHTDEIEWADAQMQCGSGGGHLVSFSSENEYQFLKRIAEEVGKPTVRMWTDALLTDGVWTWVDDSPFSGLYWRPGQPNDSGPCAFIKFSRGMNDQICNSTFDYLCEYTER